VILTLLGDRRNASLTTPKVLRSLHYHNNLLTRFKRASRPFFNGHNAPDLGITQGSAGPDEFRTAPLWGLGQRVFFLHDGRTSDLVQAIEEHKSQGSEADRVIDRFNRLKPNDKQDLINFLRSL